MAPPQDGSTGPEHPNGSDGPNSHDRPNSADGPDAVAGPDRPNSHDGPDTVAGPDRSRAPHDPGSAEDQAPRMQLVHQLRAVTVEFDLLGAEFAARHGLHPTDLRALIALLDAARAGTTVTPGRLGEQLRLNSAGTTSLVDRLERLGLVRRERDATDRRRVLLVVDEQAVELGWSFFGPVIGRLLGAMSAFDAAELETVGRFLTAMTDNLRPAGTE